MQEGGPCVFLLRLVTLKIRILLESGQLRNPTLSARLDVT
jgi:hypothetical protein